MTLHSPLQIAAYIVGCIALALVGVVGILIVWSGAIEQMRQWLAGRARRHETRCLDELFDADAYLERYS